MNTSYKWLVWFSIPSIFSSLLEPISGIVDSAFVGRIDTNWLAALALATTILNSITWMFNFLIHSSTQQVSEIYEKGNKNILMSKVKISLLFAIAVGFICSLFLFIAKPVLYEFVGVSRDLKNSVDAYFSIRVYGHFFVIFYMTLLSVVRGMKKVFISFLFVGLTTCLNIFLTWYFLFFLKYGVEGAAYATVLANIFGCIICLIYLIKALNAKISDFKEKFIISDLLNFGRNSWYLFGRSFLLTCSFFLATRAAAEIGVKSVAAHQILLQVWLFASFFTDGIAITANIVSAESIGKKLFGHLKVMTTKVLVLGSFLGLIFSVSFFVFENEIYSLFSSDNQLTSIMEKVWPLIFLSQVPNSLAFVYDGVLFGLKFYKTLRNIMFGGLLFIILPSFFLGIHFEDLAYIWWGLILLNLLRLIGCHLKFSRFYKEVCFESG